MKLINHILLFGLFSIVFFNCAYTQIILDESFLNKSIANKALKYEDKDYVINIEQLIINDTLKYDSIHKPIETIDFTSSRWIVKFNARNPFSAKKLALETGRPITDKVNLYEVKNKEIVNTWKSGDFMPFADKTVKHRKNIFPIDFEKNETKHFYLVLESDGEMINLPLTFWEQRSFYIDDYSNNLFHGFYFGVLAVVVIIFFFFYIILKEISFLYYILYVAFQFMLQFSLEGFTHQFFFPNSVYLSSISVLLSAAGAVIFVILYAANFLKIKQRSKKWNKYFNGILLALLLIVIMSLIPGPTHAFAYPLVNLLSLVGTVSIIIAIISLNRKGYKVNKAFSLGFIILIVGSTIFILGNLGIFGDAMISELSLKISSGLEILALSLSMAQRYKELQEEKENIQQEALETLEIQVEDRTKELRQKREELEIQNKNMLDSIKYAERIQNAILPTEKHIKSVIPDSFILYKPRDIVSGDFYFVENVTSKSGEKFSLFGAIDCTGHGVPGAFMSFLGNNFLSQSIKIDEINTTGQALDFLNQGIFKSLKIKEYEEAGVTIRDGMDLTLCGLNRSKNKLYFSGAKNAIQIATKKENLKHWSSLEKNIKVLETSPDNDFVLIEIKGNREAIGYGDSLNNFNFKTIELPIFTGDVIYQYSDGYPDQFGGPKNKKFGSKRFKKLLLSICEKPMAEQRKILRHEFRKWKGDLEKLDDVLVMGVRV
ncbi:hypothetical protein CW751_11840 [Brumimicrobium salinarum]|uniref:PPM-type phosphatase domain-containing protein n=1 Tax=Brumimicrobium salinarum TaxID=2058658 RepID=A0A2I0R0D4_9FLAO|nr:7TM diverse intracellular signaling domain-containing protein [Brumimicrobium salinarum]PKR80052.1 hypothetical protein CW751_11840 [Brumimicrobium salinarum]